MATLKLIDDTFEDDGNESSHVQGMVVRGPGPSVARIPKGAHQILLISVPISDDAWDANAVEVVLRGDSGPTAAQMRVVDLDDALEMLAAAGTAAP